MRITEFRQHAFVNATRLNASYERSCFCEVLNVRSSLLSSDYVFHLRVVLISHLSKVLAKGQSGPQLGLYAV